jgi:hypothetical protein
MRADAGFSVIAPPAEHWRNVQVEPGQSLDLLVTFAPTATGQVEAVLSADTNAGLLELPLRGRGV